MNILPKKRWHVRTKENIARVRKDEAEAAEKERQERLRTEQADREARISVLKQKSRQKLRDFGFKEPEPESQKCVPIEHINLFANFEDAVKTTNKEHDSEAKEKKEEYEKKIGYLTYLGQDTNEALGKKNWYEVLPDSTKVSRPSYIKETYDKLVLKDVDGKPKIKELDEKNGEVNWKKKQMLDPINAFKHLHHHHSYKEKNIPTPSKKTTPSDHVINHNKNKCKINSHKKEKKEDNDKKLQKLREARIRREQQEKYRTELFLKGLHKPLDTDTEKITGVKAKYNSQFNPELARQNYR